MNVGSYEEMLEEFKSGVHNKFQNGTCSGCGDCCSNLLPMTDKEIQLIRNYIRVNGITEQKHNIPLSTAALDMTCPFLDMSKKDKKCAIYKVRPWICRSFTCDSWTNPNHIPAKKPKEPLIPRFVRETFFGKENANDKS